MGRLTISTLRNAALKIAKPVGTAQMVSKVSYLRDHPEPKFLDQSNHPHPLVAAAETPFLTTGPKSRFPLGFAPLAWPYSAGIAVERRKTHIALICFHWHSHRLKVSLIRSTPTEMCGMRFTVWTTTVLIELNSLKAKPLSYNFGGESGIRTHVTLSSKHAFQACAFSHSAISPLLKTNLLAESRFVASATRDEAVH